MVDLAFPDGRRAVDLQDGEQEVQRPFLIDRPLRVDVHHAADARVDQVVDSRHSPERVDHLVDVRVVELDEKPAARSAHRDLRGGGRPGSGDGWRLPAMTRIGKSAIRGDLPSRYRRLPYSCPRDLFFLYGIRVLRRDLRRFSRRGRRFRGRRRLRSFRGRKRHRSRGGLGGLRQKGGKPVSRSSHRISRPEGFCRKDPRNRSGYETHECEDCQHTEFHPDPLMSFIAAPACISGDRFVVEFSSAPVWAAGVRLPGSVKPLRAAMTVPSREPALQTLAVSSSREKARAPPPDGLRPSRVQGERELPVVGRQDQPVLADLLHGEARQAVAGPHLPSFRLGGALRHHDRLLFVPCHQDTQNGVLGQLRIIVSHRNIGGPLQEGLPVRPEHRPGYDGGKPSAEGGSFPGANLGRRGGRRGERLAPGRLHAREDGARPRPVRLPPEKDRGDRGNQDPERHPVHSFTPSGTAVSSGAAVIPETVRETVSLSGRLASAAVWIPERTVSPSGSSAAWGSPPKATQAPPSRSACPSARRPRHTRLSRTGKVSGPK